ncbi:MAG: hypothetical protein Q8885_00545 [Candidatus Phytoplasma stylosanthis]|nr:hypothetical protein [Candidatus Phytoplasma stylosanthis]
MKNLKKKIKKLNLFLITLIIIVILMFYGCLKINEQSKEKEKKEGHFPNNQTGEEKKESNNLYNNKNFLYY